MRYIYKFKFTLETRRKEVYFLYLSDDMINNFNNCNK